jgi:hypothetical protein
VQKKKMDHELSRAIESLQAALPDLLALEMINILFQNATYTAFPKLP